MPAPAPPKLPDSSAALLVFEKSESTLGSALFNVFDEWGPVVVWP